MHPLTNLQTVSLPKYTRLQAGFRDGCGRRSSGREQLRLRLGVTREYRQDGVEDFAGKNVDGDAADPRPRLRLSTQRPDRVAKQLRQFAASSGFGQHDGARQGKNEGRLSAP